MALSENLKDGIDMAVEIEKLIALKAQLKAGIFQTELSNFTEEFEGHPLYAQINARIAELRVAITELT